MKKISKETIELLNLGEREATNLMEFLVVDLELLLKNTLPDFNCPNLPKELGVTKKHKLVVQELHKQFGFTIFEQLKTHRSDSIRTLACYLLGQQSFSFAEKLNIVKPLADDSNSGVREWAWIALREDFAKDLEKSIKLLTPWVVDPSDNIRRYASEISRPRGVWCKHIAELKAEPWLGMSLLFPMRSDPARYVQLSVGNWLNDAGKDHPDWVIGSCKAWSIESPTKETQKICKRAMRSLKL